MSKRTISKVVANDTIFAICNCLNRDLSALMKIKIIQFLMEIPQRGKDQTKIGSRRSTHTREKNAES